VRVLFFIPSFNDQQGLSQLVESLLVAYPQAFVLVVDDGSILPIEISAPDLCDPTRVDLIRLDFNVGLGLVSSVALDYFERGGFDVLLRLDADGQHPLEEVERMLHPLLQGHADVVWGERTNHLGRASAREIMGSMTKQSTAWVGRLVFGSQVKDWFTGFFAINRVAAAVAITAYLERYCEVQLLCIFHSHKLRIKTHPIKQLERQHGETTIRWSDGLMIFLRSALMMVLYALRMNPR